MSISVSKYLDKAKRHTKRGEIEQAVQAYKAVLDKFPNNKRAIEGLQGLSGPNVARKPQGGGPSQQQINGLISLFNIGNLDEAITQGKNLAGQFPGEAFFPNFLGVVSFELKCYEEAIEHYKKATQINPGFDEAYNNMGLGFAELGKTEEASECFFKATQINPAYAQAHNNLGNTLKELENNEAAITSYRNAIHNDPEYEEAFINLGVLLIDIGSADKAIGCFTKAIKINPDDEEAHHNLGIAHLKLNSNNLAVSSFNKALKINPDNAETHNNLGNALKNIGNYETALNSYLQALHINPMHSLACYNMGLLHSNQGKIDAAILSFNRAIEIDPDYAEAHRVLGSNKKYKKNDPHIGRMKGMLEQNKASNADRIHLNFAIGKASSDIKDYDQAFSYLSDGNRLRKAELGYESSSDQKIVEKIKSKFSKNVPMLNDTQISGEPNKHKPVFIVGMFRSGSSLTEQILASHSQVYGAGELSLFQDALDTLDWEQQKISVKLLKSIRDTYLSSLEIFGSTEPCITDKMPINFWWIGYILSALPEAKIIHTIRDPRAICWSIFKHFFPAQQNGFAFDLEDIAKYYNLYLDLMAFWHEKFPGQIYDMTYETLTNDQEGESRKLIDFIGLDWEQQCLDFHKNKRVVDTASATQVRQKIYKGSSEEWLNYEKHLGPMLEILESV